MGTLTIPARGCVYVDAQVVIYSVEKHPTYAALVRPLWAAVQAGTVEAVTSELTEMEVLVGPLKAGDTALVTRYDQFFRLPGVRLVPVARTVLRDAARLRATTSKLKTPDAVHLATALRERCNLLVTNDLAFRAATGLPVVILDDLLATP